MDVVRVNDVELGVEVHGSGEPLVLAHGYAASSRMWRHQVPVLAQHYRVVVYDTRGHGVSTVLPDATAYRLALLVDDLRALLDRLDIERAHLCGHSMGGATVAALAARHPERALSTLITNIHAGHQPADPEAGARAQALTEWKLAYARARGMAELARRHLDDRIAPRFVLEDEDERRAFLERYQRQPLAGYLAVGEAQPWEEAWLAGAAASLRGPVAIIAGDEDPMHAGAEVLHGLLPQSRFVSIAGAPHDSCNARPEAFTGAVLGFLQALASGEPVAGRLVV